MKIIFTTTRYKNIIHTTAHPIDQDAKFVIDYDRFFYSDENVRSGVYAFWDLRNKDNDHWVWGNWDV